MGTPTDTNVPASASNVEDADVIDDVDQNQTAN